MVDVEEFYRVETVTSGLDGSPYFTVLNFDAGAGGSAQDAIDTAAEFWSAMASRIVNDCTMAVSANVQVVNAATGQIVREDSAIGTNVSGTNAVAPEWTAKQGLISFSTGVFQNGRQIKGRVFVPGVPGETGELVPIQQYIDQLNNAGNGLLIDGAANATPFVIVSRPRKADPVKGTAARAGRAVTATGADGRNFWAILRSRRT